MIELQSVAQEARQIPESFPLRDSEKLSQLGPGRSCRLITADGAVVSVWVVRSLGGGWFSGMLDDHVPGHERGELIRFGLDHVAEL